MGLERHGHVQGYIFGPTPTSVFSSTSRRRSGAIRSTQLEITQELLTVAEQKFTATTKELSNVKEELSHVRIIWRAVDRSSKEDTRRSEKRVWRKNIGNAKTNASTTSRTYDANDVIISAKAVEIWRLCYIFIW